MRLIAAILVLAAIVVALAMLCHHHLQPGVGGLEPPASIHQDTGSETIASDVAGGRAWYDDVVVRVSYTVIEDPGVLSIARELIKAEPPFPAGQGRGGGQAIDWARASIAVLKVIVELANRGGKPVYYVTNAFCEVLFNATMHDDRFKPIMWRVENPIALPRIVVEEGHVLPLAVACTLDLRYSKIQPRTSITNEYYYIVTKPFRGTIEATASICSKPLSSTCKTIGDSVYVDIAG